MLQLDFNERADSIPKWLADFVADTSQIWHYPNRKEVETLIADKLGVSSNEVFLSNGGDESIELLFKLCKLQQQSVLLPLPAFSQYTHQLGIWDIDFIEVESQVNLTIDIDSLIDQLKPNQWLVVHSSKQSNRGVYI